MRFAPIHDYACIVNVEPPNMAGGIYLPEQRERMLPMGRIVALGPDFETTKQTCTGEAYPSGLKEGDVVIYNKGQRIQPPGAKEYRLCRRSEIVAKVEDADGLSETFTQTEAAVRPVGAMARAAGLAPR